MSSPPLVLTILRMLMSILIAYRQLKTSDRLDSMIATSDTQGKPYRVSLLGHGTVNRQKKRGTNTYPDSQQETINYSCSGNSIHKTCSYSGIPLETVLLLVSGQTRHCRMVMPPTHYGRMPSASRRLPAVQNRH